MEEEENIHQRLLKLRDVALGKVAVNSDLAPASYDCTVDSLLAMFRECQCLSRDKNILKFINKCMPVFAVYSLILWLHFLSF